MYLQLKEKREEVPGVISFIFEPEKPIEFTPGQYVHYVLHHLPTDDRGSDRWFTNSAAPFEKNIRITTRLTKEKGSSFKKKLESLEVDGWIEISVVEGDFIMDDPNKNYVFIAGGIGITPYRSIITQLTHDKKPINITLIYANSDQNVVYREELEQITKTNPNFKIHYVFSPNHINEAKIRELVPDFATPTNGPIFYVSGPEPMVLSLVEMLKKMGIEEERIKHDDFPGYEAF